MIRRSLSIAALTVLSAVAAVSSASAGSPCCCAAPCVYAAPPVVVYQPYEMPRIYIVDQGPVYSGPGIYTNPTVVMPRPDAALSVCRPRTIAAYLPCRCITARRCSACCGDLRAGDNKPLGRKPPGRDIERERGRIRHIERLDPARQVEPGDVVAAFARQLPQTLAFRAQHERERRAQRHVAEVGVARRSRGRPAGSRAPSTPPSRARGSAR